MSGGAPGAFRRAIASAAVPCLSTLAALLAFSLFLLALGRSPGAFALALWQGALGSGFSLDNTLQRAAPLLLTALCAAIPAQLGLLVIGAEGAFVLGGLAASQAALLAAPMGPPLAMLAMALAGAAAGAAWIGLAGILRVTRGVNETLSSLLLSFIGIAVFNELVEGPLRDPASLDRPATFAVPDPDRLPFLPGGLYPGIPVGLLACLGAWFLIRRTTPGFAARIVGGNPYAARLLGLNVAGLTLGACALGGACAGLAGMVTVAATEGRASASLVAGYGYQGVLVSFLARHDPLAIPCFAVLVGGIGAAGGLLQRRLLLPDAAVTVLQGALFVCVLAGAALQGRWPPSPPRAADGE